jgi:hypothetical protein
MVLSRFAPLLALLLEVLVFYRNVIVGRTVIPWDIRTYHLPQALFVAKALHEGELPLWNPFIYCGHPFAANIQTALFYPVRLVATLLGGVTATRMLYSLEMELVFHVLLAGVFCYLLTRELGMKPAVALIGASSFQLGAFFASQAEHLGAMEGMAWLPAVWLLLLRIARRFLWKDVLLLCAALSMTVLCGFTPVTAVVFLSSGLLIASLCVSGRAKPQLAGVFAACCAAVILLCAVVIFPGAELTLQSVSRYRSDWIGNGGGLPLRSLWSLVWPASFGELERGQYHGPTDITLMYLYCGMVTLTGALIAVFRNIRRAALPAILLVISALFMLGASTPFGTLYGMLFPVALRGILYPQYWIGPFTLSLCLLGTYGLSWLSLSRRLLIAIAIVSCVDLTWFGSNRPFNSTDTVTEPGVTETAFAGSTALLSQVRSFANATNPPARLDTLGASIDWVGSAMITELPTAGGEDPMALIRMIQVRLAFAKGERWGYYYQADTIQTPVLGALNVCCVVTRARLPPDKLRGSSYITETEIPGGFLYATSKALPRFFLVHRTQEAKNLAESVRLLKQPSWQPAQSAIVEDYTALPETPGDASLDTADNVSILSYRRNSVALQIYSTQNAFLASSEVNYPGWQAAVDGQPARIYNTNVAFRGLPLKAGVHKVEFTFRPMIVMWSGLVSLASWLALAAAAVLLQTRAATLRPRVQSGHV